MALSPPLFRDSLLLKLPQLQCKTKGFFIIIVYMKVLGF